MGLFNEIKTNFAQGIKDLGKDEAIFEDADDDENNDGDSYDSRRRTPYRERTRIENEINDYSERDVETKNMVKNEIDNIINSLEKMDSAKNNNYTNKEADENMAENTNIKKKPSSDDYSSMTTVVAKNSIIAGNIASMGDIEIYGSVCGDVECKGRLVICGEVLGNAVATNICINTAKFEGDVSCEGCVEIGEGTIVVGNLKGSSALISGAVKGEIDVHGAVILDSTAIVKGNIKAESVQIDNGAVLQGFCELAYASLDIDDFFEPSLPKIEEQAEAFSNIPVGEKKQGSPKDPDYMRKLENDYNAFMEEKDDGTRSANDIADHI